MLYLNWPASALGLCAVVPFGTKRASVFEPKSTETVGLDSLTPILLLEVSTFKTLVSTAKSPENVPVVPETAPENVPVVAVIPAVTKLAAA